MIDRAQLEQMKRQLEAQAAKEFEQWTLTRGAIQMCDYWLSLPDETEGGAAIEPPPSEPDNGGEETNDGVSSN